MVRHATVPKCSELEAWPDTELLPHCTYDPQADASIDSDVGFLAFSGDELHASSANSDDGDSTLFDAPAGTIDTSLVYSEIGLAAAPPPGNPAPMPDISIRPWYSGAQDLGSLSPDLHLHDRRTQDIGAQNEDLDVRSPD